MLNKAIVIATRAHEGQFRKQTGLPYIVHPLEVMAILQHYGINDEVVLSAAVLHDVIEDCGMQYADIIEQDCGEEVLKIVLALTKEETEQETIDKLNSSFFAQLIKCADIKSNTRDLMSVHYGLKKLSQLVQFKHIHKSIALYKDTVEQIKSYV